MVTKSELKNAHRELRAAEGTPDPPTAEEMLAYMNGELSEAEEERIRTALAAHPELARTLTEPFPEEDARPGEAGYVSEARMEKGWESLRARAGMTTPHEQSGRVLQFWRASALAAAAALVLAFGGLIWQTRTNIRLSNELTSPRITTGYQVLLPEGGRGPAEREGPRLPDTDTLQLTLPLMNGGQFTHFRLEIVDPSERVVWKSGDVQPNESESFGVTLRRGFLKEPGKYRVVLYGVDGAREQRLAAYPMRVR